MGFIPIDLTPAECSTSAIGATMRNVEAQRLGLRDAHGFTGDGLTAHIDGALAEVAVAKWLGVFWDAAVGRIGGDDVGKLGVRSTRHWNGRLRLHHTDRDDRAFVLVVNQSPRFLLAGWMYAGYGKREEWWADPSGDGRWAFFVPQRFLAPMAMLSPDDV